MGRNKLNINIDEIIDMYDRCHSTEKIARELGCSTTPIRKRLKEHGVVLVPINTRKNNVSDEDCIRCYKECESTIKAAEKLGVSRETVARVLRKNGIPLIGRKNNGYHGGDQAGGSPLKITDTELIEEAKTMNLREIAIRHDMSEERVWRRARKLGIKLDANGLGGNHRRRAGRYGCTEIDNSITLKALFKRDKGLCKICGERTDIKDTTPKGHPRRMYPTIDHIIPLSKGGTHTWDNVQLAHMHCNSRKCDRIDVAETEVL